MVESQYGVETNLKWFIKSPFTPPRWGFFIFMENNQLQLSPQQITKEVVQALFNKHLGVRNYIKAVEAAQSLTFAKDNLSADYPALKELDKLLKEMEEVRKEVRQPLNEALKNIQEVFNEITEPLIGIRDAKKAELKGANEAALQDKRKEQQDIDRRNGIVGSLGAFVNNITREVASASTETEITRIQKLIGSEKARKGYYEEYHMDLLEKLAALDEPIRIRKDFIKQKAANDLKLQEAIDTGDAYKAAELKGKQELLEQQTQESGIVLQEKAFEQNLAIQEFVGESIIETVKPKITRWKWKVEDINLLQRKMPDLVLLVPNDKAIDAILAAKRAEKALLEGQDNKFFGIIFYQEKFY